MSMLISVEHEECLLCVVEMSSVLTNSCFGP